MPKRAGWISYLLRPLPPRRKGLARNGRPKHEFHRHAKILAEASRDAGVGLGTGIEELSALVGEPQHPSLNYKRLAGAGHRFSVRVGNHYRAIAWKRDDGGVQWVWIGTHAEYDRLLGQR